MNEQNLVQVSLRKIFSMNGYHAPELMTQRNFEHISNELEKKSGIVISGTTIRRLSKGAFNKLPQIATLNAIANYFDFDTWHAYKSSVSSDQANKDNTQLSKGSSKKLPVFKWVVSLLLVVFIGAFYFYLKPQGVEKIAVASFSAHKTTGNDLPNTVVFQYDIDDIKADSFFIQQSWDKNRRTRIYKNTHTLTDIYYEPGYHVAKLIANNTVIRTIDVNIPTDKWVFYANENKPGYATEYIQTKKNAKNGSLSITKAELTENGIATDQEKLFLYSYFPSKQEISCDNFTLKTRVRMKEIRNNHCPYVGIEVYGQGYPVLIKSTLRGCANLAGIWIGEKIINGKKTDLSPITYDVTKWTDVELMVRDKQLTIKINKQTAFSTGYQQSLKMITGLSFISNGLCEVDHVALVGLDQSTGQQKTW